MKRSTATAVRFGFAVGRAMRNLVERIVQGRAIYTDWQTEQGRVCRRQGEGPLHRAWGRDYHSLVVTHGQPQ